MIQTVIVLMLENRSFDHMLGFLNHQSPKFDGLRGNESNPAAEPAEPPVTVSPTALKTLPLDPAHDHSEVMLQLTGRRSSLTPRVIDNSGFVASFEGVGLREKRKRGYGPLIMRCQPGTHLPVLSKLAKEFAVCTRWFSSVPGQTWPNRNFAHAMTSDGEVDNSIRLYSNETIFELLGRHEKSWRIYHQGAPQSWAFRRLWMGAPGGGFDSLDELFEDIAEDRLANYVFVEPDHFRPCSSSQHPSNNRKNSGDFDRGEDLIRNIYSALQARPEVFAKTIFVVTYDEHGGFYDHVPPPGSPAFRDGRVAPGGFAFDLLGVRVPAVIISPRVPAGTVITDVLDHASIAATLRHLFLPPGTALPGRDAGGRTFHQFANLPEPRTDLPDLSTPLAFFQAEAVESAPGRDELDDFQASLVWLTEKVEAELKADGVDVEPRLMTVAEAERVESDPGSTAALRRHQDYVAALVEARRLRVGGEE